MLKFAALWSISILPLLLAAMLCPIGENVGVVAGFSEFWSKLCSEFVGTHQFIYTVSFITPVVYLVFERFRHLEGFVKSRKTKAEGRIKHTPDGFGVILAWAVIIFVLTTAGYAVSTTRSMRNANTFLDVISQATVVWVYLFALLCWYFTILDSTEITPADFSVAKKRNEDEFSAEFNQRISGRK